MASRHLRLLAPVLLAAALTACSHGGQVDIATLVSNSDRVIYDAGGKAAEKKNWESARQHFRRVIDGFPQSALVPDARLALADTYFKEGGTAAAILAVSNYREFLTYYPSHPRSDYAQFMAGESYYAQKNGADRDQEPTRQALGEYQRLLDVYPSSPYAEQARQRVEELRGLLARSQFLIGYFYQRVRGSCRAAVARYDEVIKSFPDYADLGEVRFRRAECLLAMARPAEALPEATRVIQDFPDSPYAKEARRLLEQIAALPSPPPAPPAPKGSSSDT